MVLNHRAVAQLVLLLAALTSVGLFAAVPHDGWALPGVLAALLPLQLAALFWLVPRRVTAAGPRSAGSRPRANG